MNIKHYFTLLWMSASLSLAQGTHLDIKVSHTVESDLFGPVQSTHTLYKQENFLSRSAKHTSSEKARTYNASGDLLITIDTDIDDGEIERVEYAYSSTNGCILGKTISYSGGETNEADETYEYLIDVDSKQILRENMESGDTRIIVYSLAGYERYIEDRDSSNQVTRITQVKRLPNHKEYEYAVFDEEDVPIRTSRMKWNTHGLMREYHYQKYGESEYTYITKYTYPKKDEWGNWTKRVSRKERVWRNEKKSYCEVIATRTIGYFDQ